MSHVEVVPLRKDGGCDCCDRKHKTVAARFNEIIAEIKADGGIMTALQGNPDLGLKTIADKYNGMLMATGGGIDVVMIRLGEHELLSIDNNETLACLYVNEEFTELDEIFWESLAVETWGLLPEVRE